MSCSLCSENGGHFKPKYGGHFDRFFQIRKEIEIMLENYKIKMFVENLDLKLTFLKK